MYKELDINDKEAEGVSSPGTQAGASRFREVAFDDGELVDRRPGGPRESREGSAVPRIPWAADDITLADKGVWEFSQDMLLLGGVP